MQGRSGHRKGRGTARLLRHAKLVATGIATRRRVKLAARRPLHSGRYTLRVREHAGGT